GPATSRGNAVDRFNGVPKRRRDLSPPFTLRQPILDLAHVFRQQPGPVVAVTACRFLAALRDRVFHVGALVAKEEMFNAYARRVIATVQHIKALGYWTVMVFPRDAVCAEFPARNARYSDLPVTGGASTGVLDA